MGERETVSVTNGSKSFTENVSLFIMRFENLFYSSGLTQFANPMMIIHSRVCLPINVSYAFRNVHMKVICCFI